jgi:polyphenol oxidase
MIGPHPAHPFAWTPQPWGRALQSLPLAAIARHLFTTSDLRLRGPRSEEGWRLLASAVAVQPSRLARLKQVHGTRVVVIRRGDPVPAPLGSPAVADDDDGRPRADIVMTDDPAVAVAVQVADCVPLLLADPVTGAVAAVHAGWRGTAAGAARQAVAAMQLHFGTRPADLVAAIGPSIGPCCYQVGADVVDAFQAAGHADAAIREWFRPEGSPQSWRGASALRDAVQAGLPDAPLKYRLDVPAANIDELRAAGLDPARIAACSLCTACHPSVFPSYRRDGAGTGRLAAIIRPGADRQSR